MITQSILLVALSAAIQTPPQQPRAEINVIGGVVGVCVTPGGALWFVTSEGHAYCSRNRGQLWSDVLLPVAKRDRFRAQGDFPGQVGFFDAQHGVVSGYIGKARNIVFVTDDGGEKWSQVTLPESLWVYGSWIGPGKHGWLVGSTGSVIHTPDAGEHWSVWGNPFDGESRSAAICARDEKQVVVASLEGHILMTMDAGVHWNPIRPPGGKIEQLFFVGKGLISTGPEGVKICADLATAEWRDMLLESQPCISVGRHPDGLLCQLRSQTVVLVDDQLSPIQRWRGLRAETAFRLVGSQDFGVALYESEGRYELFDKAGVRSPGMQSASADQHWSMTSFDRAATGPMFGISKWRLHESSDSGKSWIQVHELESPDTVHALADGSGAFVCSGVKCWLWSSKEKRVTPIPVLDEFNLQFELQIREPIWLAVGSRFEGESAERMLQTSDTVLHGPGFESLVFGSADGGRTWAEILRSPECTVAASFFGDDNVLSLLLTNGEVVRLTIGSEPARSGQAARLRIIGEVASRPIYPMPQWKCWLQFVGGATGEIGGNMFFEGRTVQHTTDGGSSWTEEPPQEDERITGFQFLRLSQGGWLRLAIPYKQAVRVDVWRDGKFQTLRQFDAPLHDAHIDAGGRLLLRLDTSAVWSLSSDGADWTRLTDTPIPGR